MATASKKVRTKPKPRKTRMLKDIVPNTPEAEIAKAQEIIQEAEEAEQAKQEKKPKKEVKEKNGPMTKKLNQLYTEFKNRFEEHFGKIPEENLRESKKCNICNAELPSDEYWKSFSLANAGRMTETGKVCTAVCRRCGQKMFDYYYTKVHEKDVAKSLKHVCCDLNIYWDQESFDRARTAFENNNRQSPIVSEYIAAIGRKKFDELGGTFWDSLGSQEATNEVVDGHYRDAWDTDLSWDKEDQRNRKMILQTYRYDPFADEPEENQRALYRDLALMLDDAMSDDYVKARGALEVVRGFNRLENLNKQISQMERDEEDVSLIQRVVDMAQKARSSITAFCKDNGFSASYANKKAKGAGTLSGVLAEINEKQYEKGLLNMYDLETSESINQAAEASMKAIFSQLDFGANESYIVIQEQRDMIRKLNRQNKDLQEENRKLHYKIEEQKLKKKAEENAVEGGDDL